MKIVELVVERAEQDAEKVIGQLKTELSKINDDIKRLKSKSATFGHDLIAPQYKNQYNKLIAAQKDIRDKIKIEQERAGSSEKGREWEKEQQKRHDNPEGAKQRRSAAMNSGMKSSVRLRDQHGGWDGLAKFVKGHINRMTDGGKEKLHGDQITQLSDKIGVTPRTLYKWMERPEFKEVRRVLPSEW